MAVEEYRKDHGKIRLNDWVLRDEILVESHRWPLIVAFILVGSLLGWAAALLWPVPYQASAEMAVSLDPYSFEGDAYVPEFANVEFRNPDDYKHWQMSQLSVLAFSDEYLQETLNRLKELDPAWGNEDIQGLRDQLAVYWRNAGRWRLSARADDPHQAAQLVETWRQVILEKTNQAVTSSRQIYLFDIEQQAIQGKLVETQGELDELVDNQAELSSMRETLANTLEEEVLSADQRTQVLALVSRIASLEPALPLQLEDLPPEGAASQEYIPWSEQLSQAADQLVAEREKRFQDLQAEAERVEVERSAMLAAGKGLSFTLTVTVYHDAPPEISRPRPAGLAAFVGGLVGFLAWCMYLLARISSGRRT